jgi:hypothetical protein
VLSAATAAHAYVTVNFASTGAYVRPGGTDYARDHLGVSLVWLVWSADSVIEPLQWNVTERQFEPCKDKVLAEYYLNADGMLSRFETVGEEQVQLYDGVDLSWNTDPAWGFSGSNQFESGHVYLTVFNQTNAARDVAFVSGTEQGAGTTARLESQTTEPPGLGSMLDMTRSTSTFMVPVQVQNGVYFPLSFTNSWIGIYLWDTASLSWVLVREEYEPTELELTGIRQSGWYWLGMWNHTATNWALSDWIGRVE